MKIYEKDKKLYEAGGGENDLGVKYLPLKNKISHSSSYLINAKNLPFNISSNITYVMEKD